jgi:glycosyltransferase involved in cell wall biosynthesis
MNQCNITVFTPTYNRAYLLPNLYESLICQTSKDFEWLIVDDGSIDDTAIIVQKWINEGKICIKYIYQENKGMHCAHNTAYDNIETEWNTCIDSDDFMPNDAVEIIQRSVKNLENKFAGIVGLDIDKQGKIIGTKIPEHISECSLSDLYKKYRVKGDKKLVYRTSIVKKYPPYPLFVGEKFVPLGYLYSLIDQDYLLKPINEALVVVEYQNDGSSKNILKQYRKNPNGFAFNRISKIELNKSFIENFKNAIHLVSSSIFANNFKLLKRVKRPSLLIMAFPFGILLNLYIRFKTIN